MACPTLQEAREVSDWQPRLGVVSVYLGFDPADRGGAWRTELRSGVDRAVALAAEDGHERKVAMRATAQRLLGRFEDGTLRPPPRGEVGFVEVGERPGREHWWGVGVEPAQPAVTLGERPLVAELVDLCGRGEGVGVALLSAERVRLLELAAGELNELAEWELSILSGDWRERKAQRPADPARVHGAGSSGHDQYQQRLEHNRHRFLVECGQLAGERLQGEGLGEVIPFGPSPDAEAFRKGLGSSRVRAEPGGEADLIAMPTGKLAQEVAPTIARLRGARERKWVERALEEVRGGSRGAAGSRETLQALGEGRVEHLALDPTIGDPVEALVRGALASDAEITIAGNGVAELLAPAEGVAAILRY